MQKQRVFGVDRDKVFSVESCKNLSYEEISMAYTINDECINCGACDPTCPVEAISEQGDKRVIDAATCTDCGACVDSCPVDAIHPA